MAIIKHIPVKNRFYTAAVQYLSCQYDERTNQPLLDAKGRLIEREEYRIEGYNCDVDTFGADCIDVNRGFGKNNAPKDVKAHHYIISFAPEDDIDMDGAMDFGKQWIEEFVPGHQAIIAAHPDGHNGSGNVHVHIVFNSVRKYAQEKEYWHEKPCEYKEGCKHRSTGRLMRTAKEWVMDKCKQLGLRQVDLLASKHTDHYRVKERLEEKEQKTGIKQLSDKDMIRQTIDGLIPEFEELHDLINCLQDDYGWKIRVTPQTISYKMPGMKRPIRGKRLGKDYEFVGLIMRFVDQQIKREEEQAAKEQAEREAKGKVVKERADKDEANRIADELIAMYQDGVYDTENGNYQLDNIVPYGAESEDFYDEKRTVGGIEEDVSGEAYQYYSESGSENRFLDDREFDAFLAEQRAKRAVSGRIRRDSEEGRAHRDAFRERSAVERGTEDKQRSRGAKVR
jgi:hypothetical protein